MSLQFTVRGKGIFPIDMLRHDQCYPVDAEATEDIQSIKRGPSPFKHATRKSIVLPREIRLATDYIHAPTVGRWESFGWKVVSWG